MSDNNLKPAKPRKDIKVPTGYPPEVMLLPPEVGQQKAASRARSRAILVAIITLGVVVLASVGSNLYAFQRVLALDSARALTQSLLVQQGEYNDVRAADQMVGSTTNARIFAMSTEISLNDLVRALAVKFPEGAGVSSYSFESATPLQTYGESTSPLDPERMAQLALEISFPSISAADEWIRGIRDINGIADSTLVAIELMDGGGYQASVLIFIDESALLHRFEEIAPESADGDVATPAPTAGVTESPAPNGETTEEESGE